MDKKIRFAYIQVITITLILSVFGILFFVLPKEKVSEVEKRNLCRFPDFTFEKLWKGQYTDSINLWVSDNFPFRESFIEVSFGIAENRGFHTGEVVYYDFDIAEHEASNIIKHDTIKKKDSLIQDTLTKKTNEHKAQKSSNGVLIYDGMAIERFATNEKMAVKYASVINSYADTFPDVYVYSIVIPTHAEFYLPERYKKNYKSEKYNIDFIYSNLSSKVKTADAYSQLKAHKDEYIYFRTDHHWTGLGAYYAYNAFAPVAGFTPLKLEEMTKKKKKAFLGSMYNITHDSRLKEKPDTLIYHKIPGKYKTYYYEGAKLDTCKRGLLYCEFAQGVNSYSLYLGYDYPLMRIESNNESGRRAIVVKNSFGNAFATYLPYHYEKMYIVDYRYFNGSIAELIKNNNITDLIFINAAVFTNSSWHIFRTKKIMGKVN